MKKTTIFFTLLFFILGMTIPLGYAASKSDFSRVSVLLAKSDKHELKEKIEKLEKKIEELKEKESKIRKERHEAEEDLKELKEKLKHHHS